MDENFDTRLGIYGEEALGAPNLEMIAIARKHGSSAKFSGSGGAVFGMCLDVKRKVSTHHYSFIFNVVCSGIM